MNFHFFVFWFSTTMDSLVSLLKQLKVQEESNGVISVNSPEPRRSKARPWSRLRKLVHQHLPELEERLSFTQSIQAACLNYVKTEEQLIAIAPDLSDVMGTYFARRPDAWATFNQPLRQVLSKQIGKLALKLIRRDDAAIYQSRKTAAAAVCAKNNNQISIDPDEVLRAIHDFSWPVNTLTKKEQVAHKLVALELACGARISELVHASIATFSAHENDGWILQVGVSKDRESDVMGPRTISKPVVGLSVSEFLQHRQFVEDHVGNIVDKAEQERITAEYVPIAAKLVKKQWPSAMARKKVGSHLLREIYAVMSYKQQHVKGRSQTGWTAAVLGHKDGTLSAAINYQGVVLQDAAEAEDEDENVDVIQNLQRAVERMEGRLDSQEKHIRLLASTIPLLNRNKDATNVVNKQGETISVPRLPRCSGMTPEEQILRVRQCKAVLGANNVACTQKNLRAMGIGSRAIKLEAEAEAEAEKPKI